MMNCATASPPAASFCRNPPALVFTCEHGGCRIPEAYAEHLAGAGEVLRSHRGWDPGALGFARLLAARFDAPVVFTETSRLLIDCNRSRRHRRLFSEFSRHLDRKKRQAVLERFYLPHRQAVTDEVEKGLARCGRTVHVAVHSFTPVLDGVRRRVDVGLLYDPGREPEAEFCRRWQRQLSADSPDLAVRRNAPYRGVTDGFPTALRRRFAADLYLGIELELNQRLLDHRADFPTSLVEAVAASLRATLAGCDGSAGESI